MKTPKAPISIRALKTLAVRHDLQAVVILTVSRDGMTSVVTYGENKTKCKAIGDWGQGLWNYAVSLNPFQTVFGWNNGGVPKEITAEQIAEHNKQKAMQRL